MKRKRDEEEEGTGEGIEKGVRVGGSTTPLFIVVTRDLVREFCQLAFRQMKQTALPILDSFDF